MDNSHTPTLQKPQNTQNSGSQQTIFKIGDLAREFGVTLRTLRFYEDRGLIHPQRSGTTRLYRREDRERLRLALFCKRIGMSLGGIREVLELSEDASIGTNQTAKLRGLYSAQLVKLKARQKEIAEAIMELESEIAGMNDG